MKSWEITHFLFSRGDDQCIYLYTKNTSRIGNVVDGSHCFAWLWFADGELPENFIEKNKWQIHFPVSMYKSVVNQLMIEPLVFLDWKKSNNEFLLTVRDESVTYSRIGVLQPQG